MTNEDAIKELQSRYELGLMEYMREIPEYVEALGLALDALQGLSPRNGKTAIDTGQKMYECPVCGSRMIGNNYSRCYYRFCGYCGVRVNWSDNDD